MSDGNGNVEWYVNAASKGASSDGPTGDSVATEDVFQMESDNGGDTVAQNFYLQTVKIYMEV